MRRFVMFSLIAVAACAPEQAVEADAKTDTPAPIDDSIYGVAAAEDLDPADDVVEVHLRASATKQSYIDAGAATVWAYNDQVPGPLVEATVGDLVRVVFTNDLKEATTIHWHGLRIDNEMDGVPAVQDPVQPGETFTYEFVVPDAGTYWYHPHVRGHEQVERGLYGPLVVHEAEEIVVDRDRYFVLDDVSLRDNGKLYAFTTGGMDGMHGRHGNVLLVNGQAEVLTDTVRPGAVERWRIVNTANARLMYADVIGADWRVVGVDGGLLEEPYTVDELRLPVGRRFDLEVIPKEGRDDVKLRVLVPKSVGFDKYPMFEATIEGDLAGTTPPEWPAAIMPVVEDATQEVDVTLGFRNGSVGMAWTINGAAYGEDELIQVLGNTPTVIHLRDTTGAGHPFHLHGQFFEVLSHNGGPSDVPGPLDTIHVGGNDEIELYTTFDNPGVWMAHCHILEHAELGMMTAFEVTPAP
jgi:FtsP/CotA-like multicopper oxidase with cupredoxin domain